MKIFSIRDAAANVFMGVWCSPTTGSALRIFQDEVQARQGEMHKHPADYELYELGTFDNEGGQVETITPRSIARATDYIHQGEPNAAKQTGESQQT